MQVSLKKDVGKINLKLFGRFFKEKVLAQTILKDQCLVIYLVAYQAKVRIKVIG